MIRSDGSDGMERESLMTSIVGTWRLVRAEAFDASGNRNPLSMAAPRWVASCSRMMAMTGDGRQGAHADQVREYNTYAGAYTFDGQRLSTCVDSCSNPAYMGTEQVREVSHEGGLMVLRPPIRAYVGRPPEQRVLYWERISDIDG
jgi:Lipocalin-like domain